jgi:hypothetical protein
MGALPDTPGHELRSSRPAHESPLREARWLSRTIRSMAKEKPSERQQRRPVIVWRPVVGRFHDVARTTRPQCGVSCCDIGPAVNMRMKSSVGVLFLDAQLRLVHHTAEAAAILEYLAKPRESVPLRRVLPAIRSQLASPPDAGSAALLEFTSGRRRYHCRAFLLDSNGHGFGGDSDRLQPLDRRHPRPCVPRGLGYQAIVRAVSAHEPRVRNGQVSHEGTHQ